LAAFVAVLSLRSKNSLLHSLSSSCCLASQGFSSSYCLMTARRLESVWGSVRTSPVNFQATSSGSIDSRSGCSGSIGQYCISYCLRCYACFSMLEVLATSISRTGVTWLHYCTACIAQRSWSHASVAATTFGSKNCGRHAKLNQASLVLPEGHLGTNCEVLSLQCAAPSWSSSCYGHVLAWDSLYLCFTVTIGPDKSSHFVVDCCN